MPSALASRPDAAESAAPGEFAFTAGDFERVRALIRERAGINLHDGKRAMVYSRLTRRLREVRETSFARYLARLEAADAHAAEWQEFVNALTTNLTSFFRESHHFPLLAEALRQHRGSAVRIWCNAASTGEEPYSIAMTLAETLPDAAPGTLLATDIDTRVLETASRGVYPADARGIDDSQRRRHFLRGTGANAGAMRVRPGLRELIEFRPHNLMDTDWSLGAPFDIVFCRNVMIYFDGPTQRAVLERMHRAMKPGALLFAGHSENFTDSRDLFLLRGKTVYARV